MNLSFIGMSGVGKSHWARQLGVLGFDHLDCDVSIAHRLGALVNPVAGEDLVHAVGRWMGMPWSPGYAEREASYLELEYEVTMAHLDTLEAQPYEGRVVLDTTGSAIYLADDVLSRMKKASTVVYFEAPESVLDDMAALYQREPKPLIWHGAYRPLKGESQKESLARCYRELLTARAKIYAQLADVTLDYHALRSPGQDTQSLLERVWPELS